MRWCAPTAATMRQSGTICVRSSSESSLWQQHWQNHAAIVQLMRDAEATVELIRERIAAADMPLEPAPVAEAEADSAA